MEGIIIFNLSQPTSDRNFAQLHLLFFISPQSYCCLMGYFYVGRYLRIQYSKVLLYTLFCLLKMLRKVVRKIRPQSVWYLPTSHPVGLHFFLVSLLLVGKNPSRSSQQADLRPTRALSLRGAGPALIPLASLTDSFTGCTILD